MEHFYDVIGLVGTVLLIAAYFLLQAERIKSDSWAYLYMNFIAASLILFSLFFAFNLASFVIEIFWIGISLYGIFKKKRKLANENITPKL